MQKLTVPIARALANQAIARIKEFRADSLKKVTDSYKESKEWKNYMRAHEVVRKAQKDREEAEKILKDKFKSKIYYLNGVNNYREDAPYASFSTNSINIDSEELKDRILVEHFTAASGETSAQIIDRMVDEYTK